jgi:ribosomal 30S subunit maturation factor RimM
MKLLTNEWETLGDISKRTGVRGEIVVEVVKEEYQSGRAYCRMVEDGGVKITQFQKRGGHD